MIRRSLLRAAPALATLSGLLVARGAWAAPAQPGQIVSWPDVTLLDGRRWTAADAAGKAVVVVFWSTTCPFCLRHNAHIAKLHRQLQESGQTQKLAILTVARERDAGAVRRYLEQHGYPFAVTLDHSSLSAALSTRRMIPLTVTVGRDGRLRQVIPGEMFEDDVMDLPRVLA
jgi:thiol-disulfide isomerase/thioredoxin